MGHWEQRGGPGPALTSTPLFNMAWKPCALRSMVVDIKFAVKFAGRFCGKGRFNCGRDSMKEIMGGDGDGNLKLFPWSSWSVDHCWMEVSTDHGSHGRDMG